MSQIGPQPDTALIIPSLKGSEVPETFEQHAEPSIWVRRHGDTNAERLFEPSGTLRGRRCQPDRQSGRYQCSLDLYRSTAETREDMIENDGDFDSIHPQYLDNLATIVFSRSELDPNALGADAMEENEFLFCYGFPSVDPRDGDGKVEVYIFLIPAGSDPDLEVHDLEWPRPEHFRAAVGDMLGRLDVVHITVFL